jgi:hypothetical protein
MKHLLAYYALMITVIASLVGGPPAFSAETQTGSDDSSNEEISTEAPVIDLDVDSDNMHDFKFEGFDLEEDKKELSPPGKIIISTSNGNSDKDDLWDYADGFNLAGVSALENSFYPSLQSTDSAKRKITDPADVGPDLKFIPVQLRLVKGFDPEKAMVKLTYGPVSVPAINEGLKKIGNGSKTDPFRILVQKGGMRIWRKEPQGRTSGLAVPEGDFVAPDGKIQFKALLPTGDTAKLYLEYLDPEPSQAKGLKPITAEVTQDGVTGTATDTVVVTLCPANVIAHKHAKCGGQGITVPQDFGNFGYETVVIENGDDDIEPEGTSADYEKNGTQANLARDDDFVKLTFKLSPEARIPGAKVTLVHEGMRISGQCGTMGKWTLSNGSVVLPEIKGKSNIRFYTDGGKQLKDSDLIISDMKNPGTGYFSKLITDGEVSVWVEGARLFGGTGDKHELMGGARVQLVVEQNNVKNNVATVLVYRGGYFHFRQQRETPGALMKLEFRDGKGRVNTIGKKYTYNAKDSSKVPVEDSEFTIDEVDEGILVRSWDARSGKMKNGTQGAYGEGGIIGKEYWVPEIKGKPLPCGHTPPGWWQIQRREGLSETQQDHANSNGYSNNKEQLFQGSYSRWEFDSPSKYKKIYLYDENDPEDKAHGAPDKTGRKGYKWDMFIIEGNIDYKKVGIQIHPDGWRDGTAGCVGIQSMDACKQIHKYLTKLNGQKIRVKE